MRVLKADITRKEIIEEIIEEVGEDVIIRLLHKKGFEIKSCCPVSFKGIVTIKLDEDCMTYHCTQDIYE